MTGLPGPDFYDDEAVFATYMATRQRPNNPNDTLEQPILHELAGDLAGRRILDLGCGAAGFGRFALAQGAGSYYGVEASRNMVEAARATLAGTPGRVEHVSMETWSYPESAFDLVVSSLALHYVADLEMVFAAVYRTLADGGRLVLSVEHPVITSCARGWRTPQRQDWIVDDYFVAGPRMTSWLGGEVIRQHRTVEGYFSTIQAVGLVVEHLRESNPRREWFTDEAEYERRKRIPLFLFLTASKPEAPAALQSPAGASMTKS